MVIIVLRPSGVDVRRRRSGRASDRGATGRTYRKATTTWATVVITYVMRKPNARKVREPWVATVAMMAPAHKMLFSVRNAIVR